MNEEQIVIVTVTLAVTVAERWGDDCTLGQLRAQAVRSATETILLDERGEVVGG